MNNNPQISVVMPMYNASTYLHETLESIFQQTFTSFELLIVDDGSTDNSIEIVKNYHDRRICLITNTHDFISSLNKGIEAAKGKYIARMDADDLMLPHRLETQFQFMELHPDIDVCGSWTKSFGEREYVMQRPVEHVDIISSMLQMNPIMHPTVIMRRSKFHPSSCLYQYGYPCAEDYKLWTDLTLQGFKFANIPEPLLRYRISQQQVTRASQDDMLVSSIKIGLEYAEAVMGKMVEKEEQYVDLFNSLTQLYNNELLCHDTLLHTVYTLYRNFLNRITV